MALPQTPKNATTRLYVGNLQFTVDEFALIKIFSRFGQIAKLDFLFHKSGPMRGKPRGYAFIEFSTKEDAMKALTGLHDKPLRGRNLVVTFATQMQNEGAPFSSHGGKYSSSYGSHDRRTTLSMVKNQKAPQGADAQIRALEAKLAQMQKSSEPSTSASSSLPRPPTSLPPRPPSSGPI